MTKEVHPQRFNFSRLMAFDRLGISFKFVDPSNLIFFRLPSGCNNNGEKIVHTFKLKLFEPYASSTFIN